MKINYTYMIFVVVLISVIFWFIMEYTGTANRIIRNAKKYVGISEIPQNKGFYNKDFEADMRKIGFHTGYEWCSLFAKKIITDSLKGNKKQKALKLMTASTQQTFNNLAKDKSGLFKIVLSPRPGDLVIWQKRDLPGTGHAGIIKNVYPHKFTTIEGNLNNKVSIVDRGYNGTKNLKIRGFIRINA